MPVVRFAPRPTPTPPPDAELLALVARLAALQAQQPTKAAMLKDFLDRSLTASGV